MKKSRTLFALANLFGFLTFFWPFFDWLPGKELSTLQSSGLAMLISFNAILIIAFDLSAGLLDSKTVAIVGVMTALIASLRLLGAGAIGIEPMWFMLILTARIFGPRLGFSIGILAMGVSALLTGGIGPWLAFQMFAAGWIGIAVGIIPKSFRNKLELFALALYGVIASLVFGILMDLQLWPWLAGNLTQLSYDSNLGAVDNLGRFLSFHFATALSWDIPRAITTAILILIAGPAIVQSLRRAEAKISITSHARQQVAKVQ